MYSSSQKITTSDVFFKFLMNSLLKRFQLIFNSNVLKTNLIN